MKDSGSREPLILSPLFYLSSFQTKMKPPLHIIMQRGLLRYVSYSVYPFQDSPSSTFIITFKR